MNNKERNIIDKFLDSYEKSSNTKKSYVRIYQRPSKLKSLLGFIFSLLCFIVLIRLFDSSCLVTSPRKIVTKCTNA